MITLNQSNNYYEILGIESTSTVKEIKEAYRKLALKYHPDKNKDPNAVFVFSKVTKVYEILSDPFSRNKYDNYGAEAANNYDLYLYNHLFEGLFCSPDLAALDSKLGNRSTEFTDPYDVWIETNVLDFEFNRRIFCSACQGAGKNRFEFCHKCKGYGYLQRIEHIKLLEWIKKNEWFKLKEKGDQRGWINGDLYIKYKPDL